MELVPLLSSRRVAFVENREDRQIIEHFTRKQFAAQAASILQRVTFLYTYQEPVAAAVLEKARQVHDVLKDARLAALGASGSVKFLAVGDRDYRTEPELKTVEKQLSTLATRQDYGFPFRLMLWRRTEIENYLIDVESLCHAAAAADRLGKLALWTKIEAEFRAFLATQIADQKTAVIERLAARLQDRDRRLHLTAVMDKARQLLDAEWGDGVAWCDAKKVLSAARRFLQQQGIPAQALSHKNIIDAMPQIPNDVAKLLKALKALAKQDSGPPKRNGRKRK